MALKPCKECGKEISTEAQTCPNCGKKAPTGVRTSPITLGCLGLIVTSVVIGLIGNATGHRSSSQTGVATSSSSAPVSPPAVGSQWSYSEESDQMTGKREHAASVSSENTVEFGFPYQGAQRGELTLRRHPRWGTNVIFSIRRGQLLCPSYDGCSVLVRFDNDEPSAFSANGPADHSTETLFIGNYDRFVSRLQRAKTIRISPKVYQQGNVVFTFDVAGFDPKRYRGQ